MPMTSSKTYTILLLPEDEIVRKVWCFRTKYTGTNIVDGVPYPHITLKQRFWLNEGFNENDLIVFFKSYGFAILDIHLWSTEIFWNALVLNGKGEEIRKLNENIIDTLGKQIITKNPEFEGKNYQSHLTLFRFSPDRDLSKIILEARELLGTYKIKSIILAEIGEDRDFYRELYSINL